jgi:leucyl-tRNA---protein transferase
MDDVAALFINEETHLNKISPVELDRMLASGWRHFGSYFFRYNLAIHEGEIRFVVPLRIRLSRFRFSKSQSRNLRRNSDAVVRCGPVDITPEVERLFSKHRRRFANHPPDSIHDLVSANNDSPSGTCQLNVHVQDELIAVSYFDVGDTSYSGIYAMFDPAFSARGLGVFTMLKEIEFAIAAGSEFYYQGYCYSGRSFYDYKKRFFGSEAYDWNGGWTPFPRE